MSANNKIPTLERPVVTVAGEHFVLHNGTATKLSTQEFGQGSSQLVVAVGGVVNVVIPSAPVTRTIEGQKMDPNFWSILAYSQHRSEAENHRLKEELKQAKAELAKKDEAHRLTTMEVEKSKTRIDELSEACASLRAHNVALHSRVDMLTYKEADSRKQYEELLSTLVKLADGSSSASSSVQSTQAVVQNQNSTVNARDAAPVRRGIVTSAFVSSATSSSRGPAEERRHTLADAERWLEERGLRRSGRNDRYSQDAAFAAVEAGAVWVLEWLHKEGNVYSSARVKGGNYLEHVAAREGHLEILKWMYDTGLFGRFQLGNSSRHTVLMVALIAGHLPILQWLHEEAIAPATPIPGDTSLAQHAAIHGHLHILKWIQHPNDPNMGYQDSDGMTIAHYAAKHDRIDILEWLESMNQLSLLKTENSRRVWDICGDESRDWLRKIRFD